MTSGQVEARAGRVLVVCTGNVCRSPFIERMLRVSVPGSVVVTSAGIEALVGEAIDPAVAELLGRHGGDAEGFAARQVTAEMVAEADLVLTATRAHRAAVASLQWRALRYVFTLGDFSDLAVGLDIDASSERAAGSWVANVARAVADRRGTVPPRKADEVDIVDPYRREDRVMSAMARQVLAALPPVLGLLRG